jgi:hypothetical protein
VAAEKKGFKVEMFLVVIFNIGHCNLGSGRWMTSHHEENYNGLDSGCAGEARIYRVDEST